MHELKKNLLWLGHALDARQPTELFAVGIAAIVDVAYEEPPAVLPRQLIYCRFPLHDGGGNSPASLRLVVQTVVDLLGSNTPTLVACSAGMSRSPTIAAFALACYLDLEPTAVLERIAAIKSLEIKPELWRDVSSIMTQIRRPHF